MYSRTTLSENILNSEFQTPDDIVFEELSSVVKYIILIFSAIGINVNVIFKKYRCYCSKTSLLKVLLYFWNCIAILQIIALISATFTSHSFFVISNLQASASYTFVKTFNLLNRILLLKQRSTLKVILVEINSLKILKNFNLKYIRYATLFTVLHITVSVTLSTVSLFTSFSTEEVSKRTASSSFGSSSVGAKLFVDLITFFWLFTGISITAIFTLLYGIFLYIIKAEFTVLSKKIKLCKYPTDGRKLIEKYEEIAELGKSIDDTFSLPLFSVLCYNVLSIFFHGYRLFKMNLNGTYQVIFIYLNSKLYLF